jgi:chemotaxis protein MotD
MTPGATTPAIVPDRAVSGFEGQVVPLRREQATGDGQGPDGHVFATLLAGLETSLMPAGEATDSAPAGAPPKRVPFETSPTLVPAEWSPEPVPTETLAPLVSAETNPALAFAVASGRAALGVSTGPDPRMEAQLPADPAPAGAARPGAAAPLPQRQQIAAAIVVLRNEAYFAPPAEPTALAGLLPASASRSAPDADAPAPAGSISETVSPRPASAGPAAGAPPPAHTAVMAVARTEAAADGAQSGLQGYEGQWQRPASAAGLATAVPSDQFTPAMGASVGQQIADRIAGTLEHLAGELPPELPGAAPMELASSAHRPAAYGQSVLRVLHIALQPADLGTVVVRMSVRDDTLSLRLEAAASDTAQRLAHDRDELVRVLASSGYNLGDLVVETASGDKGAMAAPTFNGQAGQPQLLSPAPGQAQSWASADGRSQGGQHGGSHRAPAQADRIPDDLAEDAGVSVGLFV